MSDEADDIHLYGGPDPDNRQPEPIQGERGENLSSAEARGGGKGCRRVITPDGRTFDVIEESGIAAAVAAGAGAAAETGAHPGRNWLAWALASGLVSLALALPFAISAMAGHRPRTRRRAF